MKTIKQFTVLVLFSFTFLNNAAAIETEESGLIINAMVMGADGISISFTTQPKACSGAYRTMHAFINKKNANFSEMLVFASQKRTTRQPVKIAFSDIGDCQSQTTLLQISSISGG